MPDSFVFDVDGTLVDTAYQHTLAWASSFARVGTYPPLWRIHRAIGMGSDLLVAEVAGDEVEKNHGDTVREAWNEEYAEYLPQVRAFPDADSLLTAIRDRGLKIVLASSGEQHHVEHYLGLLDGERLADAWTTSADADKSKPAPDLIVAAMDRVESKAAVVVGDATWDCKAAAAAGMASYAVLTGGFAIAELKEAGATSVYPSLAALEADLDPILGAE